MNDPRHARTHLLDAIRLLDEDDASGALQALDAAHRSASTVLPPAWAVVPAWKDDGPWTRVVDALERAIERASRPPLRLALARARAAAGCAEAALEALDGLDAGPDVGATELLVARGTALDLLGRRDDALAAWREVLAADPANPTALLHVETPAPVALAFADGEGGPDTSRPLARGRALLVDGRFEEAADVLQGACDTAPSVEAWTALGRARHALGDPEAAHVALERARVLSAGPRACAGLADGLRAVGHPEASTLAARTLPTADRDPVVLAACADVLQRTGEPLQALDGATEALEVDPSFLPALVVRARALASLDRPDEAKAAWQAVLEARPSHPEAARAVDGGTGRTERGVARIHFDLGRSMLQRGRYREAVNAFRNATEIRPEWAEPWRQLGLTWLQLDERPAAIEAFRTALEADPDDVESAVHLGDLRREQGALQVALAAYDRALSVQPGHPDALLGRGETRRLMGSFEAAVPDFEAALRTSPDDPTGLCGLAASLNGLRRFAEARPIWLRAREHDPNSTFVAKGLAQCHAGLRGSAPLAFEDISREPQPRRAEPWIDHDPVYDRYEAMDQVDRGRSYHKERNFAAAIECFKKALEIDPTCDEAALRLGMAYEDDRQFRRAIAAYRTALEIEPNHYQAATNIGEAYRKNEQYREAIGAYDQALGMKPDYLYALAGRAECMRMLGRYEECLGWFDKALVVGPNHAFAIQGKAAALNALQRFDEALEFWNRALEIEPQSQFALDGRSYCEAQLRRMDVERGAPSGAAAGSAAEEATEEVEAESATPTLDEQGRDLTALARAGRLPKVIGRDKEIRQVMKTLVRRLKANPLLLGEPGVGKTAVVEGLAQRLVDGDAPERLRSLRIVELSMGSLIAGTKYRGTFEERLREIVKEATSVPGLVLFIDEIHTLVGAGRTEGGSLDAANILKPALARSEITVIGATTHAEYRRHFESDSALERRFQPITVEEPSPESCIDLLVAVSPTYARHHGVRIERDAIEACVHMAVRFLPDRRLPDKALDMLDEACAEASLADEAVVDREVVARVVSERTGVPVQKLTEAEREHLEDMEKFLAQRVVGQDEAVRKLADAVRLSKSGLRSQDRPRAVFLFRGASGVGKTELAKALADFLFPEGDALVRLDMSEYSDRFTSSRLLGAPPGYSGHGEEGQLTGPLRRKPYSVVLLDEFEKAHPDVQAVFLSLLDEGIVTDADGRQVNAREAFFILTTNAGAEYRATSKMGFSAGLSEDAAALEALRPYFRPELLDRVDEVISFKDLDDTALREIARMRMHALEKRALEHKVTLRWDDDVLDFVLSRRRPGERGARQTIRAVDSAVGEPLGRHLLRLGEPVPRTLAINVVDGQVRFDEVQNRAPKAPKPAPV